MVTFRCVNCGNLVSGFEGERGSYHGQCKICGYGHGSYKTNYNLLEQWEHEQKAREPITDRIQIPGRYYVRAPDWDNGCPESFGSIRSAIDWYYCNNEIHEDATLEREYEVLRILSKKSQRASLDVPEIENIVNDIAKKHHLKDGEGKE